MIILTIFDFVDNFLGEAVDFGGIFDKCRPDKALINIIGTIVLDWKVTPDEEQNLRKKKERVASECVNQHRQVVFYLCKPIEWKPAKDEIGEEFNDTEEGKHYPVGEPTGIILFRGGLQCFDSIRRR